MFYNFGVKSRSNNNCIILKCNLEIRFNFNTIKKIYLLYYINSCTIRDKREKNAEYFIIDDRIHRKKHRDRSFLPYN